MKNRLIVAAIAVLAAAPLAVGAKEDKAAAPIQDQSRTASCLVRVTFDATTVPLYPEGLMYLIRSSGVVGKAGRDILNVPHQDAETFLMVEDLANPTTHQPATDYGGYGDAYGPVGPSMSTRYGGGFGGRGYGGYGIGARSGGTSAPAVPAMPDEPAEPEKPSDSAREPAAPLQPPTAGATTGGMMGFGGMGGGMGGMMGGGTTGGMAGGMGGGMGGGMMGGPMMPGMPTSGMVYVPRAAPSAPDASVLPVFGDQQTIMLHLYVQELPDEAVPPLAQQFLMAVVDNLRTALNAAHEEAMARENARLDHVARQLAEAEAELRHLQGQMKEITGAYSLDRNFLQGRIADLESQIQETQLQKETDKVMIDGMARRAQEAQKEAAARIADDVVLHEMQQVLASAMEQLKAVEAMVERGTVSTAEVAKARENIARAKIDVAKREQELAASVGAPAGNLSRQVADYQIKADQREVRIRHLDRQLSDVHALLAKADDYESVSLRLERARGRLYEMMTLKDRLDQRYFAPPSVAAMGAE